MEDHVVMKHRKTTLERGEKFISNEYFTDANLRGRLYPKTAPLKSITHFAAPGRITYREATQGEYTEVKVGESFGPTWSTHWFAVTGEIPADWVGQEVQLKWNCNCEATVWKDGHILQGLSGKDERYYFILAEKFNPSESSLYIEVACYELQIRPIDPNKTFMLSSAEIVICDRLVYNLIQDVKLLHDMAKHLPEDSERGYQALYTMNRMINVCDVGKPETFKRCHEIADHFLHQKNGDSQHKIHAMGHSHIDTAWLWPYAETVRKCARSWSCTIRLMEKYPGFTFACSQAQQYDWVKTHYPDLYADIKKFVKKGQFIPVGGAWVEMDGNIPSGEAFIRHFLYGQRFFQKEFGITCKEFWLPDTFGYSGQLPQIMKHCGITRFLTQKLSWSLVNKFPHHTFWWEGIDGSKVLAHYIPGDHYCMKGKVEEVLFSVKNFRDKGRSDKSVYLYGFGDGGHGPSEYMLESLQRMKDLDGLPKVRMSSPDEFFSLVEREDGHNLCRWTGELYLERHNGTYTTQAKVKKRNRKCEILLHDVEFLASMATAAKLANHNEYKYPVNELLHLWKLLLLNQFHDVLPGSSIEMVYEDAHRYYKDIKTSGHHLLSKASVAAVSGSASDEYHLVWNTLSWDRCEVISVSGDTTDSPSRKRRKRDEAAMSQVESTGKTLWYVRAPSCGYNVLHEPEECRNRVTAHRKGDDHVLANEHLTAHIDSHGRVTKLLVAGSARNACCPKNAANQFVIFDDIPLFWDAWDVMDYHLETRRPIEDVIEHARFTDKGPLRASVEVSLKISDQSYLKQTISLDVGCPYLRFYTEVHWHESHKFLKVEFPTSVHTRESTYEIQMGHLQRPNHFNTSWDWARYEVCGHKWADLSEFDFGVAVLNDCKYGYSAMDNVLRLSLLRSPKAPDAHADIGLHTFTYGLMPHTGTFQTAGVIQQAYNLNYPLRMQKTALPPGGPTQQAYFTLSSPSVVLDTIKKSEDQDNCLILRLFENFGGHCEVKLTAAVPFKSIHRCNGLEEIISKGEESHDFRVEGSTITLSFKPFQIESLCLELM